MGSFAIRPLWLLGLIPLLVTDYSVALSLAERPALSQQINQGDVTCALELFRQELGDSNWPKVREILAVCDFATLSLSSRGGDSEWVDILKDTILEGSHQQRIIGFHALRHIQDQANDGVLSVELIEWLTDYLAMVAPGVAAQETAQAFDSGTHEVSTQVPNGALQAIAAETLGLFITGVISEGETASLRIFDDTAALPSVLCPMDKGLANEVAVSPITILLALSDPGESDGFEAELLSVNLAALQALRNIGYALQTQVDEAELAQIGGVGSNLSWANCIANTLGGQIIRAIPPDRDAFRAQRQRFNAVQVARVEALSAFLFVNRGNSEQAAHSPDDSSDAGELAYRELCPIDYGLIDEEDEEAEDLTIHIHPGVWFLTCLSAQTEREIASGETVKVVEIETEVRSAAIAALERLATIPAFRQELAQQLEALAQWLQGLRENERLQDRAPAENAASQDALRTALSISAIEVMGRIENLPAPFQPQPRDLEEAAAQARQRQNDFITYGLTSVSLLSLLADGLAEPATATVGSELQQRAEIAFNEIYGQDLDLVMQAISYADASGDENIQKNIVAALGALNYRELNYTLASEDHRVKQLAQFLGQSLLCGTDPQVRRDAAFALGQLAPYYPDLLHEALVNPESLPPFRYQLIPDPEDLPEAWGESLVELCQAMHPMNEPEPGATGADSDGELPKIIDALVLRLDDREENIVVAAAYALGQYGIALERNRNAAEFLPPAANEGENPTDENPTDENPTDALKHLKTCMMALVSPTRDSQWPSDLPGDEHKGYQALQSLVEKTEEYADDCPYRLPDASSEEKHNASAIAAAFVLGQVGISDGDPNSDPAIRDREREIVAHLLRSLQGRDLLALYKNDISPPSRVNAARPLQGAYPLREDSVRDAIVSYALGQIHPREYELIGQLTAAILFEQSPSENTPRDTAENTLSLPEPLPDRAVSCASVIADGNEDYFACIEDPITRVAVLGAIEIIGIEARPPIDPESPDDRPIRPDLYPEQRRARVSAYVARLRQLLTQDVSPALTEVMVTTVIERMVAIAGLLTEDNDGGAGNTQPAAIAQLPTFLDSEQPTQNDSASNDSVSNNAAIPQQFATARHTLSLSLSSIYACTGAALGLVRVGVYNPVTIDQLVHYLYAFPEPLTQLSPIDADNTQFQGNFCMPALPRAEASQASQDLPSRLDQLVIFKTGTIAALGSIGLNAADSPTVYPRRYSQTPLSAQVSASVPFSGPFDDEQASIAPLFDMAEEHNIQRVENVITCLVDIANLEMLAFHETSRSKTCNDAFAENEPTIQARPDNDDYDNFPDTALSQAERNRAIRAGLTTEEINTAQQWGLTLDEILQTQTLNSTLGQTTFSLADRAYAKLHDVPMDFLQQGLSDSRVDVTVDDLIRAWQFGIRSTDEIVDGQRRGLLIPEVIQAAKWGLTPQEFFILKVRLQEPAIAAIGQLALVETGGISTLEALAFEEQDALEQQVTGRSRANLRGLSTERIKILKLENLEAILLALEASPESHDKTKINYIIGEYLIPELRFDVDEYRIEANIDDYFEQDSINLRAIEPLADGLRQDVEPLLLAYQQDVAQIPDDLNQEFPNLSSDRYETEKTKRKDELRQTYTEQIRQRAQDLRAYDEGFRDEVLKVLVRLKSETISNLNVGVRQQLIIGLGVGQGRLSEDETPGDELPDSTRQLIARLGFGQRPEGLAQQCLSAEDDQFTQERLCHGLSRLLAAALNPTEGGAVSPANVEASSEFLQTLAYDPESDSASDEPLIESRFELERSSPVIRSNAIEHLGQVQISYATSQTLPALLLAPLAAGGEQPSVTENAIRTYYDAFSPEVGIDALIQDLNSGNEDSQKAAAQMVARLGQRAFSNPDAAAELTISINELPNLDARSANTNDANTDDYRWQRVLQSNQALTTALVRIVENAENSNQLREYAIIALGNTRTNNEIAVALLRNILNNVATADLRTAAAHALGNMGQGNRDALARDLLPDLYDIVADTEAPRRLRVVAATALAKLNQENTLSREQQFNVVFSLLVLFREIQTATPGEGERLANFNTQKALVIYALRQFELTGITNSGGNRPSLAERNLLEQIASTYAAGLNPNNPLAVRIMAVDAARELPVWDETLLAALLDAMQDANPAIRLAAVETIRFRQSDLFETSNNFDILEEDPSSSKRMVVEALAAVFWDSREFGIIRLAAGQALNFELESETQGATHDEQETFEEVLRELGIDLNNPDNPTTLPFTDILIALENFEEFSASFRNSSGFLRGSDAIFQALRSADLLAEFDELFLSEQLLFEILEAIRSSVRDSARAGTAISQRRNLPRGCNIRWISRVVPRCR